MSNYYCLIKDILTLLSPFVIAWFVYRLTTGDTKRQAKLQALYKLHESVNSVRYAHAFYEYLFEKKKQQNEFVSNETVIDKMRELEFSRIKLGADLMLVESTLRSASVRELLDDGNKLLLARSEGKNSDEISKSADNVLKRIHKFVRDLT